jgi:metallo-beta-lactamase family protein
MDQVTGAMTLVETAGQSVLVDCGAPIGPEAANWLLPREAGKAQALFLTHGHTDHVSGLPDLLFAGFKGPIYGTGATLQLARINIRDGMKLQGASDKEIREFLMAFNPLCQTVDYRKAVTGIPDLDVCVTFREAGHILGSASVDLVFPGARILCSGDLGRPDTPILHDYDTNYPEDASDIDLLVMESTYGDKEHKVSAASVEKALEDAIEHALRDGGHILIPAFAIGRTQTLLYHLNTLVESGRLRDLPVAVDSPMGIKVTDLYQESRNLFDEEATHLLKQGDDPMEFKDLYAVKKGRDSARLRDVEDPMLIIAGSGMCTGGRIVGHLQELLPKSETSVIFVGYQAHGTPGRAIQNAARRGGTVEIRGEEVPVRADITTISGLSAHADRRELKHWLDSLPQTPKRIALHHGEPETQRSFANWLQR